MQAWVRYGLIAGVLAFAATLAADLSILWLRPADLCRAGPPALLLASLLALLVFLGLAAGAGFATGRVSGAVSQAALAGLVVGAVSGCALIAVAPFTSKAIQRLQELSATCPQTRAFGGSFFIGPTPPPGALQSPPQGFFGFGETPPPGIFGTPPPGAFSTPPPGAFAPPSGIAGAIFEALGLMVRIVFGMGFAVGVAAAAGAVAAALRKAPTTRA